MPDSNSLGYWIRRRRKALDLTQQQLASEIPCSLAMIKKIESDPRRPSPQMAERLAICLSLSARDQAAFLAVAQGSRPVSFLTFSGLPEAAQPPLDRIPRTSERPFSGGVRTGRYLGVAGQRQHASAHHPGAGWDGQDPSRHSSSSGAQLEVRPASVSRRGGLRRSGFPCLPPMRFSHRLSPRCWASIWPSNARGDNRSPVDKLLDFLRPRRLLLVLDNFEQLQGNRVCQPPVPAMLAGPRPGLKILVTSRLRLNLREEHLYPLSG